MKPHTRLLTAAIGFHCDDGDFRLLATLNNNDELIPPDAFTGIVQFLCDQLQDALSFHGEHTLTVLERQDSPDYVTIDGEVPINGACDSSKARQP